MGWLDLLTRKTPDTLATRPSQFASQRVDLTIRPSQKAAGKPTAKQAEAWSAYKAIGEVGYVVDFFANCARRVSLYPAVMSDDGPIAADDAAEPFPPGLVEAARVNLDRIQGTEGGQAEVLGQMAVALKVPGEGWLTGVTQPDGSEVWRVCSRNSLTVANGRWVYKSTPTDKGTPFDPASSFIARFWRPDPEWPGLAFSELMRVLDHAESLQLISQAMRSASMSRVAGAGVLFVDAAANLQPSNPNGDEDWLDEFLAHAAAPMADPGSVSRFVPYVTEINSSVERSISDMVHLQTFERPIEQLEIDRESTLLRRIAYGLDAPPELVTGMADVNHWTGWLIQDSTYQGHVEPLMGRIADIINQQVVRAALIAENRWDRAQIDRLMVGVDASDLITRPDPTKDALDAHDRLVISDEALRGRLAFDGSDAPTPEEYERRVAAKRPARADSRVDTGTPSTSPPGQAAVSVTHQLAAVTASAGVALGDRLADIDRQLTDRVLGAADAAIRRALEKATNRARNLTRRTDQAGLLNGLDPLHLATVRAELAIDVDDLIEDADLAQLEGQWEDWTTEAMLAALLLMWQQGLLTDTAARSLGFEGTNGGSVPEAIDDPEPFVDEWSEGRVLGWGILAAAVLLRAREIIDVGPEQTPPEVGEFDPGMLIQVGPVREALTVAGGARGSVAEGGGVLVDGATRSAGEVATGETTLAVARRAGALVTAWEWTAGSPRYPFPPHQALNGVVFQTWDAPALANETGEWPGYPHWFPGDHKGCRCSTTPRFDLPGIVDSTPDTED